MLSDREVNYHLLRLRRDIRGKTRQQQDKQGVPDMSRITEADLQRGITYLNKATNSEKENTFELSCANGAYALDRHVGASSVLHTIFGRGTKKELYAQISAFIAGIDLVAGGQS